MGGALAIVGRRPYGREGMVRGYGEGVCGKRGHVGCCGRGSPVDLRQVLLTGTTSGPLGIGT